MHPKENPTYTDLFLSFFWIGLTAFGGLAMTAHIRKQIVDKRKWLDGSTFDSGLALCQVIPGAVVMQLSAYIGLKIKGVKGAAISFIGFGFPAFLVMFILAVIYKHSKNIAGVEAILSSLRVITVAIVANAAYLFGKKNLQNLNDYAIAIIAVILFLFKIHPVLVLVIASLLGLSFTNKKPNQPEKRIMSKTFSFFLLILLLLSVSMGILFFLNKEYFTFVTMMFRIDLFAFGGGLAAMPIMYHELVDVYGWFDKKTFMDGVILGQLTPGSIIIAATFFGYLHFGIFGSLLATLAVFTPSFLVLMGIIPYFDKLRLHPQFNKVINGILCSFVGLLTVITYTFAVGIHWNPVNTLLTLFAFVLLMLRVDVIWVVVGGVLISLIL